MFDERELVTEEDDDQQFDTFRTDNITCPWCGYEEKDSFEFDNDAGTVECPSCDKEFFYERITEVCYDTKRPVKEI